MSNSNANINAKPEPKIEPQNAVNDPMVRGDAPPNKPPAAPSRPLPIVERWDEAILLIAKRLDVSASPEAVRKTAAWSAGIDFEQDVLNVARAAGLTGSFIQARLSTLTPMLLPVAVEFASGQIAVIIQVHGPGCFEAEISINGAVARRTLRTDQQTQGDSPRRMLVLQPLARRVDERVSDYAPEIKRNWLRDIFISHPGVMLEMASGSIVSNLLVLATSLFSMQIWDRVVPARSTNTLWVLAIGVGMALLLDFILRLARSSIVDRFGKRVDLALSDFFYARLLDMRNDARPRSPGSVIAQMRDFEQVRELLTSTAFGVLIDVPFVAIFIFVMWLIGGSMALVPLVAVPLIIVPGLILQYPLARLSKDGAAEAALRNAILMESVYRVEDIKNLQSEGRFRALWHLVNRRSGDISLRQRAYATALVTFSATIQQIAYIGILVVGVYGILYGNLSTGMVMACSMLVGRTLAPLSQIPAALARWQNAKVAKQGLDGLIDAPVDHDAQRDTHHKPVLRGHYQFEKIQYAYGPNEGLAIDIPALTIQPGERIAILGRTGAGKSTLLRLLAGMSIAQQGRVMLDGMPLALIDAGDVRRNIGVMTQESSLFYGSLRENLVMGQPLADGKAIERALKLSCADRILLAQPHGLDLKLRESGQGLSGGQRQVLMLARLLLRDPNILLMDEPTAALDEGAERDIIHNLQGWLGDRTLVVATHRPAILTLMTRIIVIDQGRIVVDAPRDEALAKLTQGVQVSARPAQSGRRQAA